MSIAAQGSFSSRSLAAWAGSSEKASDNSEAYEEATHRSRTDDLLITNVPEEHTTPLDQNISPNKSKS